MKCPKCEKEMIEGYIPVARIALYWIPSDTKMPLSLFIPKNGIRLSKSPKINVQKATSYYCDTCRMVIIPVPQG